MKVHDLKPAPGSHKAKKRVARGIGGKGGKTAGRGTKGQRRPDAIAALRGIPAEEFVPKGLLEAYLATEKGGVPGTPHPQPGDA